MENKIKRSDIEMLQAMLDRMNTKISLEEEIDTWNTCCAEPDEKITIIDE